jgi:amino acid permease
MFGGDGNPMYIALIGIAGFTGTLCWVGILYSQIVFRNKLKKRGYDPKTALTVKAVGYPALAWISIIIQVAAMILLIFEVGDGIPIFVLSMDIILWPIVIFQIQKYRGKIRQVITLGADEITFDEKYPDKNNSEKPKAPVKVGGGEPMIAILIVVSIIATVFSFLSILWFNYDLGTTGELFTDPSMVKCWVSMIIQIVCYVVIFLGAKSLNGKKATYAEENQKKTDKLIDENAPKRID